MRDANRSMNNVSFQLQARKKRVRSREGGLATLTVYVSGEPQPDVYWRKDRRDVDTLTGRFRVIDGGTLQVGPNFKKNVSCL